LIFSRGANYVPDMSKIAAILEEIPLEKESPMDRLMPAVYEELRSLAQLHLRNERRGHTLQPTALANEAYLKLARQNGIHWQDRIHFFGAAGQAIRRILVDHARGRKRQKRARHRVDVALDSITFNPAGDGEALLALDGALEKLFTQAPRKARVVELRFFSGLTAEDSATLLGVTTRTVERDWRYARAWLFRELGRDTNQS
jgi:RNA polymerase sigma-70 factor, ECF subfamily